MLECTANAYCDANVTACLACSGLFVAERTLGTTLTTTAPTTPYLRLPATNGPATPTAPSAERTLSAVPTFAVAGQACLEAAEDGQAVTTTLLLETDNGNEIVFLERSNQLCTLWQVNPSRTHKIPIGRSYHGYAWEPYSGKYDQLEFHCDSSTCSVTLPPLPNDDYQYELVAFDHELPSREDEVARFLEQATFGPTRETIRSIPDTFEEWIKDQQEEIQMSSHRQFFRERATQRSSVPSARGISTHPCKAGSRYRKYALTDRDNQQDVTFYTDPVTGRKLVIVDDQARTVLDTTSPLVGSDGTLVPDGQYRLCGFGGNDIGEILRFRYNGRCDDLSIQGEGALTNPKVFFDSQTQPTNPPVNLGSNKVEKIAETELYLTADLDDENCNLVPPQRGKKVYSVIGELDGQQWLFDPQLVMLENTLENPLMDGGGPLMEQTLLTDAEKKADRKASRNQVACSNVPMTFLNEDFCQLSYDPHACSLRDFPDTPIILDTDTFKKIYQATGNGEQGTRYVYAVEGLDQTSGTSSPPCTPGQTSRWMLSDCLAPVQVQVGSATTAVFATLLSESMDRNDLLRDVTFPLLGSSCDQQDETKFDFLVEADGKCWLNVHRDHLQVYDFSGWVAYHPGGTDAIESQIETFLLQFPDSHDMDRWEGWSTDFRLVLGRYGDSIAFSSLPSYLATEEVASSLGAVSHIQNVGPTVVCGSHNESENQLSTSGKHFVGALLPKASVNQAQIAFSKQKKYVWLAIALNGQDALRQRVAWTLSQILVVSTGYTEFTEAWVSFYDVSVSPAYLLCVFVCALFSPSLKCRFSSDMPLAHIVTF